MKNKNRLVVASVVIFLLNFLSIMIRADEGKYTSAIFNELDDMLTVDEAVGRFEWLNRCQNGLLIEIWEKIYDSTQNISKTEKIAQLRDLWISSGQIQSGKVNYLTFAKPDFTNPYDWYAGTDQEQSCSLIPSEFVPVALKTTVLKHKYCKNESTDSDIEWIRSVRIGDFEHSSTAHRYTFVSGRVVNLFKGNTVDVTVHPGNIEPDYPSYVMLRVWVDWNQNGKLEEPELVHKSGSSKTFNFKLNVPKDVPEGITLMRIASDAGGGFNDACYNIQYGEVEDYLINVR